MSTTIGFLHPEKLLDPAILGHPVPRPALLETHVSWVLLTGSWAYKIKKPVDFGFLDYSTADRRRDACHKELAVNRRYAPWLYDRVLEIRGTPEAPRLDGEGPVIEHALRMVEFPQECRMDRILERGALAPASMESLAREVSRFHRTAARVEEHPVHGAPPAILGDAMQNFEQSLPLLSGRCERELLHELEDWTRTEHGRRSRTMRARWRSGSIRECHGDLHLQNLAWIEGAPVLFDAIEFNEAFRWIDPMSEIAFLLMDLEARGERELAERFLDTYLEETGDYEGVELLPFYKAYRAMVRAKIALFALADPAKAGAPDSRSKALARFRHFAELALESTVRSGGRFWITHGLPGSGKTTVARALAPHLGARILRSDAFRKRLHGMSSLSRSSSPVGGGIYDPSSTEATYRALEECTERMVKAGEPVIVDATFLKKAQRARFQRLGRRLGTPVEILDVQAPPAELRRRVAARAAGGADASEADLDVLEAQRRSEEPLDGTEGLPVHHVDSSEADWLPHLLAELGRPARRAQR